MSFWSKFGKIAGIAGAGAATLATMGAASPALGAALGGIGLGGKVLSGIGSAGNVLGKIGGAAGDAGTVLGGMAKGRAEGRQAETNNALQWNQLQQSSDAARNNALQQEFANRLGLSTQESNLLDTRLRQTRQGDLQANVQDVHIPDNERVHVQHWTGGIRPSALGPNARAAGQKMSDIALDKMGNEGLPSAPTASFTLGLPMPQAGKMDSFLGAASPALSLIGAVSPYLNRTNPVPNPNSTASGGPQLNPADIALGRQNNPHLLTPEELKALQTQAQEPDDWETRLRGE